MGSNFDMSDYVDVAERIREFRAKHPEGTLQSEIVPLPDAFAGSFIAVKSFAYRTPDDLRPGTGLAYEPVPGKTSFTKDSELQNAETSAIGRAIIAVGAADTKRGMASREEVRNRQADEDARQRDPLPVLASKDAVDALAQRVGLLTDEDGAGFVAWRNDQGYKWWPGYEVSAVAAMNAELDRIAGPMPDLPAQASAPAPPASPVVDERDPFDGFSKDDLIGACRLNDLAISGTKEELLARLRMETTKDCGMEACPLAASNELNGSPLCPEHESF